MECLRLQVLGSLQAKGFIAGELNTALHQLIHVLVGHPPIGISRLGGIQADLGDHINGVYTIRAQCASYRQNKGAEHGVLPEEEETAYANLADLLDRMEAALTEGPWLLGGAFTLADIAMAPYVNRIEVLERPEMVAETERPRIAAWWRRIQDRPGFQEAFSFANPDASDPVKR